MGPCKTKPMRKNNMGHLVPEFYPNHKHQSISDKDMIDEVMKEYNDNRGFYNTLVPKNTKSLKGKEFKVNFGSRTEIWKADSEEQLEKDIKAYITKEHLKYKNPVIERRTNANDFCYTYDVCDCEEASHEDLKTWSSSVGSATIASSGVLNLYPNGNTWGQTIISTDGEYNNGALTVNGSPVITKDDPGYQKILKKYEEYERTLKPDPKLYVPYIPTKPKSKFNELSNNDNYGKEEHKSILMTMLKFPLKVFAWSAKDYIYHLASVVMVTGLMIATDVSLRYFNHSNLIETITEIYKKVIGV